MSHPDPSGRSALWLAGGGSDGLRAFTTDLQHDGAIGQSETFGPLEPALRPLPTTVPLNRVFGDYAGTSAAAGSVLATFSSNCPEIAGVGNPATFSDAGVAVLNGGNRE